MTTERYIIVCDVDQGVPPSEATCSTSYVLQVESNFLPSLTLAEGAEIAVAILVCWAAAWAIKQIVFQLRQS